MKAQMDTNVPNPKINQDNRGPDCPSRDVEAGRITEIFLPVPCYKILYVPSIPQGTHEPYSNGKGPDSKSPSMWLQIKSLASP